MSKYIPGNQKHLTLGQLSTSDEIFLHGFSESVDVSMFGILIVTGIS